MNNDNKIKIKKNNNKLYWSKKYYYTVSYLTRVNTPCIYINFTKSKTYDLDELREQIMSNF